MALLLAIVSGGWLGCADDACSGPGEEKAALLDLVTSHYFFNGEPDQLDKYEGLDLSAFASQFGLLDALRYLPDEFDRGFSYITTPAIEAQVFEAGITVAFGISLEWTEDDRLFIREVSAGSPAEAAGLERGDEILEIGGRAVVDINEAPGTELVFGPSSIGVERSFLIRPIVEGEDRLVVMAKNSFSIDFVPDYGVFDDAEGEPVGYLLFHGFVPLAAPELTDAFDLFAEEGVTRLVIDLRYNGGGSLDFAGSINNVLGARGNDGEVQYGQRFDSSTTEPDVYWLFAEHVSSLPLDRVVFVTTDRSASASELLINALRPYRDVHVVGSTTHGKPVGQSGFDYCGGDYRLRLVTFDLVNSEGAGEYYGGIEPTCPAEDDLGHNLGDPAEDSLATALSVAATGVCPDTPVAAAHAPQRAARPAWLGAPAVPWLDTL